MRTLLVMCAAAVAACRTLAAAPTAGQPDFHGQAVELVAKMELEEKVLQLCFDAPAIERLDVPKYNWWNECLHGVARAGLATVFPQAIGMAAAFDRELMHRVGETISDEARAKYNDFSARGQRNIYQGLTFWTPNINIFRDPRWGRGMETYGEDPYLTGELATGFIKGLQGDDPNYFKTVATAKHFVVHSGPEQGRHSFDARTSPRDFYETYTPHFRKAIEQGGVWSIMCAYNRYEGEACCGSPFLDDLLRNKWGFRGYIVSDCGAIEDVYHRKAHELVKTAAEASVLGIRGGTDLCCGNAYEELLSAVRDGLIEEREVDRSVVRLMEARLRLGLHAPQGTPYDGISLDVVDSPKHRTLSLETARKSMVLLRNEGQLPLDRKIRRIAVIGPNADSPEMQLGNYNGFPSYVVTALEGIRRKFPRAEVVYAPGCALADGMPLF
ncbi:MAG: glycoside hydrolase family 3 C-terminal domain-containing protein, partial [Rikenellaceae bacterium]|nr:glycoside hydrolase family 3 C-terminal domain-containing protein [Rikenellaceae bacterium]